MTAGRLIAIAILTVAFVTQASAQGFPEKPVRIVSPFAAGNTLDTALRIVNEVFQVETGQPILIDNRPGGSGVVAAQAVAQAVPDGYTLLLANTSLLTINPHTFKSLPYDAERSFKPVTNVLGATIVMAAHLQTPGHDLAAFVDWARANPGKSSFASFTAGNSSHFAGVLLNRKLGIDMLHVPFNGTPPAVQSLLGAQVHTAFVPLLAVRGHVASGKLKVFAVTSPQRSSLLPDVPTFRELGHPELDIYIWSSIVAPSATPDPIISRLNEALVRALRSELVQSKWRALDFEPLPSSPAEALAFMRAESKRWGEAVRLSGFKAD